MDRDEQFLFIDAKAKSFMEDFQSVISFGKMKIDRIDNFKNTGDENMFLMGIPHLCLTMTSRYWGWARLVINASMA